MSCLLSSFCSLVLGISSTVKSGLEESLVQILSPHRRVDILRDVMAAQRRGRPYSVTFCGVNGVGKSTNLAKVCIFPTILNKVKTENFQMPCFYL